MKRARQVQSEAAARARAAAESAPDEAPPRSNADVERMIATMRQYHEPAPAAAPVRPGGRTAPRQAEGTRKGKGARRTAAPAPAATGPRPALTPAEQELAALGVELRHRTAAWRARADAALAEARLTGQGAATAVGTSASERDEMAADLFAAEYPDTEPRAAEAGDGPAGGPV
jgi:hypothetical protein